MAAGVLTTGMGVSGGGVLLVAGTDGAPGVMGGAMMGGVCGVTGGAMAGLLVMADGGVRGGVSVLTGTVLTGLLVTVTGVTAGVLVGVVLTGLGWLGKVMLAGGLMLTMVGGVSNSLMPGLMGEKITLKTLPVRMLTKRSSMRRMTGSIGSTAGVEALAVAEVVEVVDTGSLSNAPWMALSCRAGLRTWRPALGTCFLSVLVMDNGRADKSCFVGPAGIQSDRNTSVNRTKVPLVA
jgi:hypothetical protein